MGELLVPEKRVCIGYCKGELLPPYDRNVYYDVKRIQKINELLKCSHDIKRFDLLIYALQEIDNSDGILEVIGAWADDCVPEAVGFALSKSRPAIVDTELVVFPRRVDDNRRSQLLEGHIARCYESWARINKSEFRRFFVEYDGSYILFSPN